MRCLVVVALLAGSCTTACVVERTFPDAEEAPQTGLPDVPALTVPVQIVNVFPPPGSTDVPIDSPIWFELDQYIDPTQLSATTIRVQTGSISAGVRTHYDLVGKRLVARRTRLLEPDIAYIFTVNPADIVSVTGAPMTTARVYSFATGSERLDTDHEEPTPTWSEVEAVLDEGCGCHTLDEFPDPWFEIPALEHARIVNIASIGVPDRAIVEPFAPHSSVLMHKVLANYPDRVGTQMPPAWAGDVERTQGLVHRSLTQDEQRLVADWILAGAQP